MAEGLELRRRGRLVARDVALTVEPGQSLLVTGRNGAGKTTLLRVLAGVAAPAAGRLLRPPRPHAYVPERVALAPAMPVAAWLASMGRVRGRPAAPAALDPAVAGRRAGALSKGQLQRVVLGEALGCAPALLVLDEPWAGLDAPGRRWLADGLRACLERGAVAVVTDHSGAGDHLFAADARLHLGADPAPQDGGDGPPPRPAPQDGGVAVVAVDPAGRRHELVVPLRDRDARLRELLEGGWAVEEVRPR